VDTYISTYQKQARNIYLSQLIMKMNEGKLSTPFNESPKTGPLSLDVEFSDVSAKMFEKTVAELEKEKEVCMLMFTG